MGEFDLSLIREFRSRPAFYDRNDSRFKDKLYTAHEWQEISYKLGYDVSLLKDRMLQLRNRYNLEKRRLEILREENPGEPIKSAWPLYEQLSFLSEHIRARRSYKRLLPFQNIDTNMGNAMELSNSASNPASMNGSNARQVIASAIVSTSGAGAVAVAPSTVAAEENIMPTTAGLLTVKMEEDSDEDDEEQNTGGASSSHSENEPQQQHSDSVNPNLLNRAPVVRAPLNVSLPPSISIRRLETMRDNNAPYMSVTKPQKRTYGDLRVRKLDKVQPQSHNQQQQTQQQNSTQQQPPSQQQQQTAQSTHIPNTCAYEALSKRILSAREHKFVAFGDFMSASLLELPPARALQLVEKFTSEVVGVLMQKSNKNESTMMLNAARLNGELNGP